MNSVDPLHHLTAHMLNYCSNIKCLRWAGITCYSSAKGYLSYKPESEVTYLSLLGSSCAGLRRKVALGLVGCSLWDLSGTLCLAGAAGVFLAERLILSSNMLMSFSDNWKRWRRKSHVKLHRAWFRLEPYNTLVGFLSYISYQFVDLVTTDIVDSHHRVECSITDRRVSVTDVNSNFLQRLSWSRLAYIHPIALYQTTQLLQTF